MDLISRQAAIDVLHGYFDGMLETDTVCPADIYGLFKCIPSSQPERKGYWIKVYDGWDGEYYDCSECGCSWTLIDGTPEDNGMKYCPNCGAKMEE